MDDLSNDLVRLIIWFIPDQQSRLSVGLVNRRLHRLVGDHLDPHFYHIRSLSDLSDQVLRHWLPLLLRRFHRIDLHYCSDLPFDFGILRIAGSSNCFKLSFPNNHWITDLTQFSDLYWDNNNIIKDQSDSCNKNCDYRINKTKSVRLHTIVLKGCGNLVDVSALKDITDIDTIDLRGCYKITDVTALPSMVTLDIRGCTKLTNLLSLRSVANLYWSSDYLKGDPFFWDDFNPLSYP